MITMIIAIVCGGVVGSVLFLTDTLGYGWSSFWGVVGFIVVQVTLGRIFQKKVKAKMEAVQQIMVGGQKRLESKVQRWQKQMRPIDPILAQSEIARDQKKFIAEALAVTDTMHAFDLWVPLMKRQIATAQFQLRWMIKDFKGVDVLEKKILRLDPNLNAMILARQYMRNAPLEEMTKLYEKSTRRLKYNQNVILAATWSWILVKRNQLDAAFKVLTEALKNSDNETLKANHAALANNRVMHFNNSGLGERWWSLFLEEPKVRKERPRMVWR